MILIGLQLQDIGDAIPGGAARYAGFGLAILATVVLVRFAWTFAYNALARLVERVAVPPEGRTPPARSYKSALVVGWCGMRGLLTLATALALPYGGAFASPEHRDLVIVAAFSVVLGTLVLQGLTLGPLLAALGLGDDGRAGRERTRARQDATRAALRALEGDAGPEAAILRREYAVALDDEALRDLRPRVFGETRMRAIAAERDVLEELRRTHAIGEDAFRDVEEELDWAEGNARRRARAPRATEA